MIPDSNNIRPKLITQLLKIIITQFSARHFKAHSILLRISVCVEINTIKFYA